MTKPNLQAALSAAGEVGTRAMKATGGVFAFAAGLGGAPAGAQQVASGPAASATPITATTDCSQVDKGKLFGDIKCEIARGEALKRDVACFDDLLKFGRSLPTDNDRKSFGRHVAEKGIDMNADPCRAKAEVPVWRRNQTQSPRVSADGPKPRG